MTFTIPTVAQFVDVIIIEIIAVTFMAGLFVIGRVAWGMFKGDINVKNK